MYDVFSGTKKDYYLTVSTKCIGQNFKIYKKVLIGDDYEEAARERLRQKNVSKPSRNAVAHELKVTIEIDLKEMCDEVVDPKKQPEDWIPKMKQKIEDKFKD